MSKPTASLSETVSRQPRPISFSGMNVNQVKSELTAQLNDKENMLNKIGNASQISRNALIKQTDVIRKELLDLNQYQQQDELPDQVRSKLEDLANEVQFLKKDSPLSLPPAPTNSSPSKHRNKVANGNRRNPDIEFATEIGQGLLIEVRKLQVSLQEREETIKHLEVALADKEKTEETSQRYLRQREEIEERLKEENWNLEVANQELRGHLTESNQVVAKHNAEYSKLSKQLKSQAEQIDIMKAQEEKSLSILEAMKARHEQETYQLRRHAASAQRDNAQTQKQLEALNTELKICKARLAIKMATASRLDDGNNMDSTTDASGDANSEPDAANTSTTASSSNTSSQARSQAMETETLKQSLAHAHRIISNLRSTAHKEKFEKFELKKMLSDSQENVEMLRKEMANWNAGNAAPMESGGQQGRSKSKSKRKGLTKKRRGGVARQPRGLCPNESDQESRLDEEEFMEENGQEEEDMEEEEDDDEEENEESEQESDDEHNFANYFGAAGNTLDSMFASVAMKPLSSELESKVQVIDVGINTDPVEFASKNPLVMAPVMSENDARLVVQNDGQETTRTTQTNTVLSDNIIPTQQDISSATVEQRQAMVQHATALLSPDQIEILIKECYLHNNASHSSPEQTLDKKNTPHNDDMIPKSKVDEIVEAAIVEKTADLIPKSEVDQMVEAAIHSANTIPKSEVEEMIKKETAHMVPKSEVDQIVEAAIHSSNMIPKSEVEEMVKKETARMVPKSDVDQMIEEAIQSSNMIPKSEAEEMVKKETAHMVPKSDVDLMITNSVKQIKSTYEEQIKLNMIPKSEAEVMVQTAKEEIRNKASEGMVSKSEAETMAMVAVATATEKMVQRKAKEDEKTMATVSDMISKQEADEMVQQATLAEQHKIQEQLDVALQKQRSDMESLKQLEVEKLEASFEEMNNAKKNELDKLLMEFEARKAAELEGQRREMEGIKQVELEEQRQEIHAIMHARMEERKAEIDAKLAEIEQQRTEADAAKQAEIDTLVRTVETYKKDAEENNQRMMNMLTKDSADVLVKRAVAAAMEAAEKKHSEAMAGMISREYALGMVKDEVAKALEAERKATSEREEKEMMNLISKAEAEALAKVAAADAIVKERQAMAAREEEMITKEEADLLAKNAAREAADKERSESASVLAKERKTFREKEELMISKEEAEQNTKEAVRAALVEHQKLGKAETTTNTTANLHGETPLPTRFSQHQPSDRKSQLAPEPTSIERSVSTSRLTAPSLNVTPAPSVSTPTSTSRKLKLSSSVSSLRLGRKENNIQKSQRPSIDNATNSFGSFRVLETSKYSSHRFQSKSSVNLRELSNKQNSSASISTMSSTEDHHDTSRMPMPMRSDETFSGFPSGSGGTDYQIISAITQTMIGEWMDKHTRRYVGGGISENKHQRFFWVHPYTGTLYWSSVKPGFETNGAKAKSAFVESVTAVPSHDSTGASPMSLLIRTPKRDLKITAPTLERHELWMKSIKYLIGRPNEANGQIVDEPRFTFDNSADSAGHQQMLTISTRNSDRSVANMAGTTQYDSDDSEDMVNIRQCCDGKHDISTLSQHHHHH